MEQSTALHAIQFAVAPVFLLTAIATLISALATRLARIIDRARDVEERLIATGILSEAAARQELRLARVRGGVVNVALGLLTVSAALIGATVMTLFVGGLGSVRSETLISWSFLGGVVSFIFALLCFLTETLLATRVLRFGETSRATPPPAAR